MIQGLLLILLFAFNLKAEVISEHCAYPLRTDFGITSAILKENYLIRIHKTLAGELDPFVLGDGGVVAGYLLSESKTVLVFYENSDNHPFTSKVDRAFSGGWSFLLVKKSCTSEMKSKKHIVALHSIATRVMYVPKDAQIFYFSLQ